MEKETRSKISTVEYILDGFLINKNMTRDLVTKSMLFFKDFIEKNCSDTYTGNRMSFVPVGIDKYKELTASEPIRRFIMVRSRKNPEKTYKVQVGTMRYESHTLANIRFGYVDFHRYNDSKTLINMQVNNRLYGWIPGYSDIMESMAKYLADMYSTQCVYLYNDTTNMSNKRFAYYASGRLTEEYEGKYIHERTGVKRFIPFIKDTYGLDINEVLETIFYHESIKLVDSDIPLAEDAIREKSAFIDYYEDLVRLSLLSDEELKVRTSMPKEKVYETYNYKPSTYNVNLRHELLDYIVVKIKNDIVQMNQINDDDKLIIAQQIEDLHNLKNQLIHMYEISEAIKKEEIDADKIMETRYFKLRWLNEK